MTSPALIVLFLALVCSIFGTASERLADYDNKQSNMKQEDTSSYNTRTWTNINNRNYDENVNEFVNNNALMTKLSKMTLKSLEEMKYRRFYEKKHITNKYIKAHDTYTTPNYPNIIFSNVKELSTDVKSDDIRIPVNDRSIKSNTDNILESNLRLHRINVERRKRANKEIFDNNDVKSRVKRDDDDPKCEFFKYNEKNPYIMHPHAPNETTYYKNSKCVTVITANDGYVIELTFIDIFRIEDHPECAYDYLEIRDGRYGYAAALGKKCGQAFPKKITTTGPYAWLKFYSDDTIEYEGFKIQVEIKQGISHTIPESCYIEMNEETEHKYGYIDSSTISKECLAGSENHPLDVLWKIETEPNTKIYINFTSYQLAKPNECDHNLIQVFGKVLELDAVLASFCGSVANPVTTKGDDKDNKDSGGNVLYVRLFATKYAKAMTKFIAKYNAFRTLDTSKGNEDCDENEEFDCQDNTCINKNLICDGFADCRLKADEESCDTKTESIINQTHILVILVIFSLILSGMCFVFIFKCIKKLYKDHQLIKEHIKHSCEERLDSLDSSHLTLDPKRLQRDSEPRASLERENHTNEMYKKQRSFSKHEPSIRDSDFMEESRDLEDDPWRREVNSIPIDDPDIRIERNGRSRKSDISRKEESIRSRTKESEASKVKKEIRDVSVGAPDTKESGCQTRESLFQTDPPASSEGSGSQSRGFSTFGYSGATIVKPSSPEQTQTSEITIELLKKMPSQESKPQKKILDRRPMSTETTRSAPDVIIVSKPIR